MRQPQGKAEMASTEIFICVWENCEIYLQWFEFVTKAGPLYMNYILNGQAIRYQLIVRCLPSRDIVDALHDLY